MSQQVVSMASTRSLEAMLFPGITQTSPELGVLLVTASVTGVSLQCYYPYIALPFPFSHLLLPVITSKNYKKADIYWRRRH